MAIPLPLNYALSFMTHFFYDACCAIRLANLETILRKVEADGIMQWTGVSTLAFSKNDF